MKNFNLYKLTLRLLALTMVAAMFVFSGCGDDDNGEPTPTQNIWQIVESHDNLASLEAELKAAGLDATLAGSGNFTLFAPSDAALATLLGTLNLPDFSPVAEDVAQAVLSYHIANSAILSSDLTVGNKITTLQGEQIEVVGGPKLSTGATSDAGFVTTDIKATNGVVHIVDVVLVPPTIGALIVQTLGTAAQPILLGADFTILSGAMQKADAGKNPTETILGALVGLDAITVFAVPNAVFDAASITVDSYDAATWDAIIRKHIIAGKTLSPLVNGTETAINGTTTLTISTTPGLGTVAGPGNASPVPVAADAIPAGNGVVYPIGGMIQ